MRRPKFRFIVLLVAVQLLVSDDSWASGAAQFAITGTPHQAIPDGDSSGSVFELTVDSAEPDHYITDLDVVVDISGDAAFNGDLYAYLAWMAEDQGQPAAEGVAVLINRPGRDSDDAFGTASPGFNQVLFDDSALNGDIHEYAATLGGAFDSAVPFIGAWQPDGRLVDPSLVTAGDPRTAMLSVFNGRNPNGKWLLYVADVSPGGQATLNEWSLRFTTVPEPGSSVLLFLAGGGMAFRTYRRRRLSGRGSRGVH